MPNNTINYSSKKIILVIHTFYMMGFFCFLSILNTLITWPQDSANRKATLGCLERLALCSPRGPCSPGSGTGPGEYTYLSKCSHKCQSFARSSAPAEQIGIIGGWRQIDRNICSIKHTIKTEREGKRGYLREEWTHNAAFKAKYQRVKLGFL